MENKEAKDNSMKEAFETISEAEAEYYLSEWFGAIFYFLLHFGKIQFEEIHRKKFRTRNVWTGWALKIILVTLAIYVCFVLFGD